MKTLRILLCGALAILGTQGCIVYDDYPYHHGAVAVEIGAGHVHDAYCGHYYYGGRWYISAGHRHCYGCGHAWIGGRWVVP